MQTYVTKLQLGAAQFLSFFFSSFSFTESPENTHILTKDFNDFKVIEDFRISKSCSNTFTTNNFTRIPYPLIKLTNPYSIKTQLRAALC